MGAGTSTGTSPCEPTAEPERCGCCGRAVDSADERAFTCIKCERKTCGECEGFDPDVCRKCEESGDSNE